MAFKSRSQKQAVTFKAVTDGRRPLLSLKFTSLPIFPGLGRHREKGLGLK